MDHLCFLCLVFAMLLLLFIAALWSPAGKKLTSWLLFVMFNCDFVTFPCGILGQVWHLAVSIPDLCHLSTFMINLRLLFEQSKKRCKDQESIQPSTTSDPGYQWESDKLTVRHHKRQPRGQSLPSR